MIERYAIPKVKRIFFSGAPAKSPPHNPEDLAVCLRTIADIIHFVRGEEAKIVLVLTPDRIELSEVDRAKQSRSGLIALGNAEATPLVDMLPILRKEASKGTVLFRDGVHPNETGY